LTLTKNKLRARYTVTSAQAAALLIDIRKISSFNLNWGIYRLHWRFCGSLFSQGECRYKTLVQATPPYVQSRYGLNGPGIESRCGRDFPNPSRPVWGPLSLLHNGYRVSFPGVKRTGGGVNHPSVSSAEVKEIIELNL